MATEEQANKIANNIVDNLLGSLGALERYDGIPRELSLAALIKATALYAKELAIPLDNLKKAIEAASKTGE